MAWGTVVTHILYSIVAVALGSSVAMAAPDRKAVTNLVKEIEAAVKANDTILKTGDPAVYRKHGEWFRALRERADKIVPPGGRAGACNYAAGSAWTLWDARQRFHRQPTKIDYEFLSRRAEDYHDNMQACRDELKRLK